MKEYQSLSHTKWDCFVSTVGLDEEAVRTYIRNQEKEDAHYDQLKLGLWGNRLQAIHGFNAPLRRSLNKPLALPGGI